MAIIRRGLSGMPTNMLCVYQDQYYCRKHTPITKKNLIYDTETKHVITFNIYCAWPVSFARMQMTYITLSRVVENRIRRDTRSNFGAIYLPCFLTFSGRFLWTLAVLLRAPAPKPDSWRRKLRFPTTAGVKTKWACARRGLAHAERM